jgi:hypothetical protein
MILALLRAKVFCSVKILFYALSHKLPLAEFTKVVYAMELIRAERQKREAYLLTLSLCSP